mmetsp:Transcript_144182/g.461663  ORF Transcript_144182/g.461663 Transcript_144182/m.461663 type:complete len:210 (+) Transcript_144182:56-685(+)
MQQGWPLPCTDALVEKVRLRSQRRSYESAFFDGEAGPHPSACRRPSNVRSAWTLSVHCATAAARAAAESWASRANCRAWSSSPVRRALRSPAVRSRLESCVRPASAFCPAEAVALRSSSSLCRACEKTRSSSAANCLSFSSNFTSTRTAASPAVIFARLLSSSTASSTCLLLPASTSESLPNSATCRSCILWLSSFHGLLESAPGSSRR